MYVGGVPPTHSDHNFGGNQFGGPPTQPQYTPSHGGNQFSPPLSQQFGHGGDRIAVAGAETLAINNYKPQYGGHNASSFPETGVSGIHQNFEQQRQPASSQSQDWQTSPPVANLYGSPSGHSQYVPQSSPGVNHRLPATSEPTIPPSGDINTLMNMQKKSLPSGHSDEMVFQPATVSQDHYPSQHSSSSVEQVVVPSTTSPTFSRNSFDRPQETAHPTSDTTPYGGYGGMVSGRDRHVAAAASHQDIGQSSADAYGGANVMAFMEKEHDIEVTQKSGIDLQKLHGVEDTATQARIKELEVQLQNKEQERNEIKRNLERTNAQLNNRIRRLEDQLKSIPSSTGGSNEVSVYTLFI